jgi:hypothetical protein
VIILADVLGGRAESGGDQEGAGLVAIQGGGVRLVVQSGAADVRGRGVVEELFLVRQHRSAPSCRLGYRPSYACSLVVVVLAVSRWSTAPGPQRMTPRVYR